MICWWWRRKRCKFVRCLLTFQVLFNVLLFTVLSFIQGKCNLINWLICSWNQKQWMNEDINSLSSPEMNGVSFRTPKRLVTHSHRIAFTCIPDSSWFSYGLSFRKDLVRISCSAVNWEHTDDGNKGNDSCRQKGIKQTLNGTTSVRLFQDTKGLDSK